MEYKNIINKVKLKNIWRIQEIVKRAKMTYFFTLYIFKLTILVWKCNCFLFCLTLRMFFFIVVQKVISYCYSFSLSWLNPNSNILLISRALNKLMFETKAFFHYLDYIFVWDENQMAAF